MHVKKLMVVVPVVAAVCLSPGAILRAKIGQAISGKMPELIGPGTYTADVTGGVLDIVLGRLARVDIRGRDVKMSNGVVVDRLDIALSGVHFKMDQTVTRVDSATFSASVAENDLNNWLATSRPDLHDGHVALEDSKLTLTAKPKVLLLRTPIKVEGTLEIVNRTKLDMILKRVSTRGIRVPGFVRGRIQHDINPVLDAEQMGIGAKFKSAEISTGAITVKGTADVNEALGKT